MAININSNFKVGSPEPLDTRFQFKTLLEMKQYAESVLYDGVLAYNMETNKYYTYNSKNMIEGILGKWREFTVDASGIIYFNSQAEWEGARLAGELDPDKYYAFPSEYDIPGGGGGGTSNIYFSGKEAYEKAKAEGKLDEAAYYAYVGGFAKGSTPIVLIDEELSDTSENAIQNRVVSQALKNSGITYFDTQADWEAAAAAGTLDPDKYYSYPDMNNVVSYETVMKIEFQDGTTKDYIFFCKEV